MEPYSTRGLCFHAKVAYTHEDVKIINILKDDSFQDILSLFRQSPAGEVILVLPRVGKLFHQKDHFAAFASEASSGNKTVSLLTGNPQIAETARAFGFTVMAANPTKTRTKVAKKIIEDTPSDDDIMPQSDTDNDVPLTSDELPPVEPQEQQEQQFTQAEEAVVATPAMAVRKDLDYIDAVWRDIGGRAKKKSSATSRSRTPSFLGATLSTSFSKKVAAGILGAAVVVLAAVIYLMTGSAHVALTPIATPVDTQIIVQASDVFASVDDTFAKLPGQLLDVQKSASNTVNASGTRDVASKARGMLTVTNAYSSTPQSLVATTRFQSTDGKIFRTLQTITVPGSTVSAGKTIPGTTTVQVIADQPGPSYNIPAGTFVIAAFKEKGDTEKVAKFYGTSSQAMSGGASGPSKVVTQADYDSAKDAAVAAVKDQIASAVKAMDSLTVLNADTPTMSAVQSTVHPDDAADAVTITASGSLQTVAFHQSDLLDLIRRVILKQERLTVLPDTLKLSYRNIVFKPDLGILSFTVSVQGTGYAPVDTAAIKRDISGKDSQAIHDYFNGKEGIQSATITLSPFWVRTVPSDPDRTTIDINYSQVASQ